MAIASNEELLVLTDCGLYCPDGDFYVDPWRPVERAVITHAHSDHARWGMGRYLCAREGAEILKLRVGPEAIVDSVEYGEALTRGSVRLSLHPAGHILGSSQVRIERNGRVAVVSGDYKTEPDPTCAAFEPLRCHTFVTESTFGLPIYRWPPQAKVFGQIHDWWRTNQASGKASILMGYALGKCQRVLAGLDPSVGPIFLHGAAERLTQAYRNAGIVLPITRSVFDTPKGFDWSQVLVLAPPSVQGTPWLRRFGDISTAFLSGWMAIRGTRRRRSVDRGFVLSDHVDWPCLLETVAETGAENVWVTHGYANVVARYLEELGLKAKALPTAWEGEEETAAAEEEPAE